MEQDTMSDLKMPFPYFGGKRQIAPMVWALLGDVRNYVEPFAGSCAVLLARPSPVAGPETLNDYSCHLVNAIRAIRSAPVEMAELCVAPVCEVDTEAQHYQLVSRADELRNALGDPDYYDARLAAWWVKGACEWIGSGWASGEGPWQWTREGGWVKRSGKGINRKLPHLGDGGRGVNRQHEPGVGGEREQRVAWLREWLSALSDRLVSVRVACGDFERVLSGPALFSTIRATSQHACGIFLDPPYNGTEYVYGTSVPVSQRVRAWCAEHGADTRLRIVLAGRGEEHDELCALGWTRHGWKARRGYADHTEHTTEALWASPGCMVSAPAVWLPWGLLCS